MEDLPFSPHEVVLEVLTGDWVFKLRLDDVRRPRLKNDNNHHKKKHKKTSTLSSIIAIIVCVIIIINSFIAITTIR